MEALDGQEKIDQRWIKQLDGRMQNKVHELKEAKDKCECET